MYAQGKTAADGKVSLALDFRAGNRQVLEGPAPRQLIGGERGGIIHLDSWPGPRLHLRFIVHFYRVKVWFVPGLGSARWFK